MARIQIDGTEVQAISPEGKTASMPLPDFMNKLTPRRLDSGDIIYPDGVKALRAEGGVTIVVHQTCPQVHSFKWIAKDSPAPFGSGAKYRNVRIGLPYLVTLAVFRNGPGTGGPMLSEFNECFFRTAPLESFDDELFYPALLNCSKFTPPDGRPLSWICTQHLNLAALAKEPISSRRVRQSLRILMHCLLETGFNYSSENHEGSSWFTESIQVDPRVSTVDAWQDATTADPLFVLEVPWLKTGHALGQVTQRIFKNLGAANGAALNSAALARVVFNHNPAVAGNSNSSGKKSS
jgi:hypothetical protein